MREGAKNPGDDPGVFQVFSVLGRKDQYGSALECWSLHFALDDLLEGSAS